MFKRLLYTFGFALSVLLLWFAVSDYRAAKPIAEENLRGLALSMTAAIEYATQQDPTFTSLARFQPADLAFFAIIDRNGIIRFHSNNDLIGTYTNDAYAMTVMRDKSITETRLELGTGEQAYQFHTPLYVHGNVYALCLTLHTYRADAVIRRARLNLILLVSLLGMGGVMATILYRFALREERLQRTINQRENLARLGEMGALLAHEIRNPLAGIKGYAQIIEKRPVEQRNEEFARGIVSEAVRLEALVNDLLSYARNDQYAMGPVDLGELIHAGADLVRHEADAHGIVLEIECPDGLKVVGSRDRLLQVFLNLAQNAVQAMPEGGNLLFSAVAAGPQAVTTVRDTGQGISDEDRARIFEPFFTTKARGTGLGLAFCLKTIGEHRGTIRVESAVGAGTAVIMTLPRPEGDKPPRRT